MEWTGSDLSGDETEMTGIDLKRNGKKNRRKRMNYTLTENEQRELRENEIIPVKNYAEMIIVKTDEDNRRAGEFLKTVKGAMKRINDKFNPIVKAAHEAHSNIKNLHNEFLRPLETAELNVKSAMLKFTREIEAEQRRKQAEADAAAKREEERKRKELEDRAAKWEAKGNAEKAEVLKEQAAEVYVPPVVVEKQMSKVAGISYRETWTAEIVDVNAIPREYMLPNMQALNAFARATKGVVRIPGVEFKCEKNVSSRAN